MNGRRLCWLFSACLICAGAPTRAKASVFDDIGKTSLSRNNLLYMSKMTVGYGAKLCGASRGNSQIYMLFGKLVKVDVDVGAGRNSYDRILQEELTSWGCDARTAVRAQLLAVSIVFSIDLDVDALVEYELRH
jgi:hypothetical protein